MLEEKLKKKRDDIVSVCLGKVKDKMRYLSSQAGLSISGYLRQTINKEYKKEKKKDEELTTVG